MEESLGADDGRELGPQHLEGDLTVVPEIVGEKHRRHPARPELALHPVPIGECRGQPFQGCGHRVSRVRSKTDRLARRGREVSISIAI
jgi:hypothetical protein